MACELGNIYECKKIWDRYADCQRTAGHIILSTNHVVFAENYMEDCEDTGCEHFNIEGEE